jgi:hypothetical protein
LRPRLSSKWPVQPPSIGIELLPDVGGGSLLGSLGGVFLWFMNLGACRVQQRPFGSYSGFDRVGDVVQEKNRYCSRVYGHNFPLLMTISISLVLIESLYDGVAGRYNVSSFSLIFGRLPW